MGNSCHSLCNRRSGYSSPYHGLVLRGCSLCPSSINPYKPGLVKVKGEDWTAISQTGETIEVGSEIRVVAVEGVKLLVTKK